VRVDELHGHGGAGIRIRLFGAKALLCRTAGGHDGQRCHGGMGQQPLADLSPVLGTAILRHVSGVEAGQREMIHDRGGGLAPRIDNGADERRGGYEQRHGRGELGHEEERAQPGTSGGVAAPRRFFLEQGCDIQAGGVHRGRDPEE
jgi:hypothetical protein